MLNVTDLLYTRSLLLLKAECYSPSANTSSKANNTYKHCYVPVHFSSKQ